MRRRNFIRNASGVLGVTAIAGCSGDGNGNGGTGTTGTASGTQNQGGTLRVGLPPIGAFNVQLNHLEETGRLDELMNEAGYDYELERTFGYPSLFTSGQVDLINENPPMLARMAAEQGTQSVLLGANAKNPLMGTVPAGSSYTVSETGSPSSSIQQASEDGATYGITGWVTAETASFQLLYDEWGVTMTQDESNFEVISTQFAAISNLLTQGELDLGQAWPVMPGYVKAVLDGPNLQPLFNFWDVNDMLGFDAPLMLGGPAVTADVWEQKREGVLAFTRAMDEAATWYLEAAQNRELQQRDNIHEPLGRDTLEAAQWYLDWAAGNDLVERWGEEYEPWQLPESTSYDGFYLTDDIISANRDFTNRCIDLGFVEEDWEDNVSFQQLEELQ